MNILLLGAGGQGGPCASIMARDKDIKKVVVADTNLDFAQKVIDKIGSPKIELLELDCTDINAIVKACEGMDCIIDLTAVWLGPTVIEAALKANVGYVSTSFDVPYLDQIARGEERYLDKELKAAGVKVLMGCGLAPGFVNVVVRKYCDKLDTVKSFKYRLGKQKLNLGEFGDVTDPWNPGWSPKQALIDFSNPCYVFRNGKFEELPPFTEIEDFPFPAANQLVSHHTHEEVVSTPVIIGKGIEYCDFKYYVARQAATFVSMGLASQEEVEFGGGKFKPIDFIVNYVPKPGNAFLDEDPDYLEEHDGDVAIPSVLIIEGTKAGKPVEYKIHCPKLIGRPKALNELFGTSYISIALPAVIGAKMLVEGGNGLHPGINLPEELDPERFFEHFFGTGIPYEWEEL